MILFRCMTIAGIQEYYSLYSDLLNRLSHPENKPACGPAYAGPGIRASIGWHEPGGPDAMSHKPGVLNLPPLRAHRRLRFGRRLGDLPFGIRFGWGRFDHCCSCHGAATVG